VFTTLTTTTMNELPQFHDSDDVAGLRLALYTGGPAHQDHHALPRRGASRVLPPEETTVRFRV
jgi:hypothetical protein